MRVDLGEERFCLEFDGHHGIGAGDPAQRRVVATRELDKGPGELRRVRFDPQLAEVYFTQMERGAHHQKALCVVAARLAERAWVVLSRGEAYELRDVDGTPVTPTEARCLIQERYTVSEEVRRRRRSRKSAEKAPHQVL